MMLRSARVASAAGSEATGVLGDSLDLDVAGGEVGDAVGWGRGAGENEDVGALV